MEHRLGAICTHGQLARQCELCDKDREIERLRSTLDCRTCMHFVGLGDPCRSVFKCIDAKQYVASTPVQMWRKQ